MLENKVKKNSYFDSATLMLLSSKIGNVIGSNKNVAVMMGTDSNKDRMRDSGLLNEEGAAASPNDVIFAVKVDSKEVADEAFEMAEELLAQRTTKSDTAAEKKVHTVEQVAEAYPDTNLAVVSLPGDLAGREARKLLEQDKHVLLFSDNVTIEEEIELKDLALEKGLLMMGPDCGTAVIHGVGLGFANELKRGDIGVIGASGTGLQEVTRLISNHGGGISQAFGTGGRDVKEAVGGRMFLACMDILEQDPDTNKIVLVSKPPAASVVKKIAEKIKGMSKPVIACFLGADDELLAGVPCTVAHTLEEAACKAIDLDELHSEVDTKAVVSKSKEQLNTDQKYVRGLYCGGTLAYETILILKKKLDKVYSNVAVTTDEILADSNSSKENTVLDLGEDEFTVGRPHPMIEPALRGERLLEEVKDPEVAVILTDVEIGYGSNPDAGSILAEEVKQAREYLSEQNREIIFVSTICGTYEDYQGYDVQKAILEDASIVVLESNAQAARLAQAIIEGRE